MFKGFFGKKKSTSGKKAFLPQLSTATEKTILGVVGARAIPIMPRAAQKAFTLATDPNAEVKDFVEVIESDESLSARVLRIANSVYYERGRKSETLDDAVRIIGVEELKGLLNANTLAAFFPSSYKSRYQLWSNDIATAIIARELATKYISSKKQIAFLGGLMHDIGKLLLLQRAPKEMGEIMNAAVQERMPFYQAEEQVFPFDHTEVGQLVARRWKFTQDLEAVIRLHHHPFSHFPEGRRSVIALVKCADTMAHALGIGHASGMGTLKELYESYLEEVWSFLEVEKNSRRGMLDELKRAVELEFNMYEEFGS